MLWLDFSDISGDSNENEISIDSICSHFANIGGAQVEEYGE